MRKLGRRLAVLMVVAAAGLLLPEPGPAFARSLQAESSQTIRAAKRGNVRAQARLGWMYLNGRGVPQNFELAALWYERAARRGHGAAQFQLGLLYDIGQGVPHDLILAYYWLNLSAAQAGRETRDFRVRIRNAIASKMTFGQVATAQRLSVIRFPR